MDAGITTVKIKCQDAVGYLAVYRYLPCLLSTYVVVRYMYRYLSKRTVVSFPISQFRFFHNVREPGRAGRVKIEIMFLAFISISLYFTVLFPRFFCVLKLY
jgi:hypothetical protein